MRTVTVPIGISNGATRAQRLTYIVSRLDPTSLKADPMAKAILRAGEAEVLAFGLIVYRCGNLTPRDGVAPAGKLDLKLPGMARAELLLVVDLPDPPRGRPDAVALFSVAEERQSGRQAGGVVVAVTAGGVVLRPPVLSLTPAPLPLALADGPILAADPVYPPPGGPIALVAGAGSSYLGALLANAGPKDLENLVVYPESVSLPGLRWTPVVAETTRLNAGDKVWLAVPVDVTKEVFGRGRMRIVAYADGFDRTRIDVALSVSKQPRRDG